jgi:hypothetical protein
MTNPSLFTNEQEQELITLTKDWLGYKNISHLQKIKDIHGTLDATWMEHIVVDNIPQYIPRCVFTQEVVYLKNFLSMIEMCKDWSDDDFKTRWIWLLEESIKEE